MPDQRLATSPWLNSRHGQSLGHLAYLPAASPFLPLVCLTTECHVQENLGEMAGSVSQLSKFGSSTFLFCTGQKNGGKYTSERNHDDLGESGNCGALSKASVVGAGGSLISSPTAPPAGYQPLLDSNPGAGRSWWLSLLSRNQEPT